MRLLLGASPSKFFHMKEFVNELEKLNIECKLVLDTDILIDKNDKGFKETGLSVSSKIQLHRIITISSSAIKRELGNIDQDMQAKVSSKLKSLF